MKKYPLLQAQLGVFALCMKYPLSTCYNCPIYVKLSDDIDMYRLADAWNRLIEAHPIFKNRFEISSQGEVCQYSDPQMEIKVVVRSCTYEELKSYIHEGFIRPYNLLSGEPLVRVELITTEKGKYLLYDISHTITDGITEIKLINHIELASLYDGGDPLTETVTIYEAAEREKESLDSEEYQKVRDYYRKLFEDYDFPTLSNKEMPEPGMLIRESLFLSIGPVNSWCEENNVKVHHFFRAAFVYTMELLTRQTRIGYRSSHAGRDKDTMDTHGMFVTNIPLMGSISKDMTVVEAVSSMKPEKPLHLSAYPITHFYKDLKKKPTLTFNYMAVEDYSNYVNLDGKKCPYVFELYRDSDEEICVNIYLWDNEYEIRVDTGEGINDRRTVKMVCDSMVSLIDQMIEKPFAKMGELSLVSLEESKRLIELSFGGKTECDPAGSWLDLFAEKLCKDPEKNAVVDSVSSLTYKELDTYSEKLARWLIESGVQRGDFVATKLPRRKEYIIAILAIHKAGAAYVPIDPEYPDERIKYMIKDCRAKLLIEALAFTGNELLVNGQRVEAPAIASLPRISSTDTAYMIYTSGSTGRPKGAMISHGALLNYTVATVKRHGLTENDRFSHHCSFSSDAHIESVFPVLSCGACVYIMPEEILMDLHGIAVFLQDNAITGCYFIASIGKMLIREYNLNVRFMTIGAEEVTNICSNNYDVFNEYGPTECTNVICDYKLEKGRSYQKAPIGRPSPGGYCFVVDQNDHLLPEGAVGELCYAGAQTGIGYFDQPEKTARVFESCPFVDGTKMYHTGDLVKWNEDRQLIWLGRIDDQVKVRGFRIELGEIEKAAMNTPGILRVIADVKKIDGTDHIVLYYTTKKNSGVDKEILRRDIEASALAKYMYPEIYMHLDEFPYLPNRKIDRKKLPAPVSVSSVDYVPPESEAEISVVKAMEEVVGKGVKIGALDDFFELGGDSVSAILLVSMLRKKGLMISVSDFMRYGRVREIAAHCVSFVESPKEGDNLYDAECPSHVYDYRKKVEALRKSGQQAGNEEDTLLTDLISRIDPADLGETSWDKDELSCVLKDYAARGECVFRIFPLTGMQEAMLHKVMSEPDSLAYRILTVFEMDCKLTEPQLKKALDLLARRHETLRSRIVYENVSIYRQLITDGSIPLYMADISSNNKPYEEVKRLMKEIMGKPLDMQRSPLFSVTCIRISKEKSYLITLAHHIILDGWGMELVIRDLGYFLSLIAKGKTVKVNTDYDGRYEKAVRELAGRSREKAYDYWKKLLSGYDTKAEIASYEKVPEEKQTVDAPPLIIDEKETRAFIELCRKAQATVSNGIELVWGMVLSTYSRSSDIVFAKVVSGRDNTETEVEQVAGLLINSVPVRFKYDKTTTVIKALRDLKNQAIETSPYDYIPLSEIMSISDLKRDMIRSVIGFENYGKGIDKGKESAFLSLVEVKGKAFDDLCPSLSLNEAGQLCLHIDFNPEKYTLSEIQTVQEMFHNFVREMPSTPDLPLCLLPRLDESRRREIALMSKGDTLIYDRNKTFIDLFLLSVKRNAEGIAVVDESGQYTYRELDAVSNTIAKKLISTGIKKGDFVALKMGREKEFAAAVIAVMKAGAAYLPVDPQYPKERIRFMLEDSKAQLVITNETFSEYAKESGAKECENINRTSPDSAAYIIYTSGSSGTPKGVVQSHRALSAFLAWQQQLLNINEKSVHAEHTSFSFDGSLCDLICPLAFGGQVHILPEDLRKNLPGMKRYFKEHGITGLLLSTQIGLTMLEEYKDLNLEFLVIGGEKMKKIKKPGIRVINAYGPTEFTVISSYHVIEDEEGEIPIGRPVPNSWSFVLDEEGHLLPKGLVGELCLMGDQLAEGYFGRKEQAGNSFVSYPEIEEATKVSARVYRTGDIVRYNSNNELIYIGRKDEQVKIRGFRVEPGEIENAAAKYEGISQAKVTITPAGEAAVICLYYTAKRRIESDDLRRFLSDSLAEYMVPTMYMQLDKMPLTVNGKIDKNALPKLSLPSNEYFEPVTKKERIIVKCIRKILKLEHRVGALDDFFEIGGDSISGIRLSIMLRKEGLVLSVSDLMRYRIVRDLAEHSTVYKESEDESADSSALECSKTVLEYRKDFSVEIQDGIIQSLDPKEFGEKEWGKEEFDRVIRDYAGRREHVFRIFPLTGMQEAMLHKTISEPDSLAYRMVSSYEMDALPTESQLLQAVDLLAKRHEMLRSRIVYENVSIYRQLITDKNPPVRMVDLSGSDSPLEAVKKLQGEVLSKKLNLQTDPLFAVVCAKVSAKKSYLILAAHHIIQDGWGMELVLHDLRHYLALVMEGKSVEITPAMDGKYENAVNELIAKDRQKAYEYWNNLLNGYDTKAQIPSFGKTTGNPNRTGKLSVTMDADMTKAFETLCKNSLATISNGIELVFGMVLSTYTRSRDVVFAKVVSGRDNTDTNVEEVAGLFINSVPVRFKYDKDTTVKQALRALNRQAFESAPYDYCSLSEIIEATGKRAELACPVLAFENYASAMNDDPHAEAVELKLINDEGEFFDDICPVASMDKDGQLIFTIGFDSSKYTRDEIVAALGLFKTILSEMIKAPDRALCSLPRLDREGRKEIALISKGDELYYDKSKTFIDLFLSSAKKYGKRIAVVDKFGEYTYEQLDRITDIVAARLIGEGVQKDDFVAVKMNRVKEFAAAVISVMKAGAAYIPVDPEYPEKRISFMLKDSGAKVILTKELFKEYAPEGSGKPCSKINRTDPDAAAYMIYTSGSEGEPKGVAVSNRALSAFLSWRQQALNLNEKSVIAHYTSFSFDASLDDLFCPLACGAKVHILSEEIRSNMQEMKQYFDEHKISGLTFPTKMGIAMMKEYPDMPLSYLMVGGERMFPVGKTAYKVINGYGPTEFTVCSSYHVLGSDEKGEVPIGRPVPNSWSFVCDEDGHLLPKGIPGELCLLGDQMAMGYHDQQQTKDSFVSIPEIKELVQTPEPIYRTGDIVRYNRNNELEYIGRIDEQIKLRGYRIDPGEIEKAVLGLKGVESAVAAVKEYSGDKHLVLYYVAAPLAKITERALKEAIVDFGLADFMYPEKYVAMDKMPLLPNGKIDRKSLPDLKEFLNVENVAPYSGLETKCLMAARQILGNEDFGVTDDLFSLGMTSISATLFILRINNLEIHQKYRVSDLMHYRNIRDLINGKQEYYWKYSEFDPKKDYLVFLYGVVPIAKSMEILKIWSQKYNIFVIESIDSHYDSLFGGDTDFKRVVETYLKIIDDNIPKEGKLKGFAGFSWGGVLSWHLAARWAEIRKERPFVFMGASNLIYQTDEARQDENSFEDTYPENIYELTGGIITKSETVKKLSLAAHLDNTVSFVPRLENRIILLNPLIEWGNGIMAQNIEFIKGLAKDVKVVDFPDKAHDDLYFDPSLAPVYLDIMVEAENK